MNKNATTQIKVLQCIQCENYVEFYCSPCKQNLCMLCKQKHTVYLDTKNYDVAIYRLKHGAFVMPESCDKHPECKYKNWCVSCECPICNKNDKHQGHRIVDIKLAYKILRGQHKKRIIQIRGESLPYNRAILAGLESDVKRDVKTLKAQFSSIQQELAVKAENLKKLIEIHRKAVTDLYETNIYMSFIMKHQKMTEYVHIYEQLANKPVRFLLFIKKTPVPKTIELPDNIKCNFNKVIRIRDTLELLVEIKITEARKRQVRNEHMLRLLKGAILNTKHVDVTNLYHGGHISFVTSDRLWISDGRSLILTNSKGNNLHHLFDVSEYYGVHTVNSAGELNYVDKEWNINKLSADNTTKSTLMKRTELWEPWCICHSSLTGDLLVMMRYDTGNLNISLSDVKVIRYNSTLQPIQTIQYHKTGEPLYRDPVYITENRIGDIIVSDIGQGVVVTDREGKYRFTYTGPPKGLNSGFFMPSGICVDTFLNILICGRIDQTIHMIDKDGYLLSIISTKQDGMVESLGLGYDEKNHLVWMGSGNTN
ncbi:uncharacterized protein LOC134251464 [Saccostrea cucullata]|uniref:uncharacterized protein LOC134251464 n=1 Tax=Saccostrea cuccullata TaxID=36930 RepID=UPI002ED15810